MGHTLPFKGWCCDFCGLPQHTTICLIDEIILYSFLNLLYL